MDKQNLLTQLKIKNDKFNNQQINFDIFNSLSNMKKTEKQFILNKILSNNFMNKLIIEYLFNNINLIIDNNQDIKNINQFLNKLFYYINIYHSELTFSEWIIYNENNIFKCKGTYDLSYKDNKDFIEFINKIMIILQSILKEYIIDLKMYEKKHGHLLIIFFEIK